MCSSASLEIPRKRGWEHRSLPQGDEFLPPLESGTHRSSLACCHQMSALHNCRLSFLSWALFLTPRPCRPPGSSRVLVPPPLLCHHLSVRAMTTNPTPALQAEETRAQLPQTSTKTLGLFSLGSTVQSCRPVRGCGLQKQKTDRQTHTLRKLLRGLATLRPPLLRKSKVRNSEEKGEMILQNHDQLFPVVWDL